MIKMNANFLQFIALLKEESATELDPVLQKLCDDGFVRRDGAFLLTYHLENGPRFSVNQYQDLTGYECIINKFYVNDFVKYNSCRQAAIFVHEIVKKWNSQFADESLNIILSFDGCNIIVRFHKLRQAERYLADDFDGFKEGVFEMSSRDIEFFSIF